MEFEEGIQLLEAEKYQEAYEYFKKLSKTNNTILVKFFCTYIHFQYIGDKQLIQYYEGFQKLLKISEPYIHEVLRILILISLDLDFPDDTAKFSRIGLSLSSTNPVVYYGYALTCHNTNVQLEYFDKVLGAEDTPPLLLEKTIAAKIGIYRLENNYVEIEKFLNKLFLTYHDINYLYFIKLDNELKAEQNEKVIQELEEKLIPLNSNDFAYYKLLLDMLIEYYTEINKNIDKALQYQQKYNDLLEDKVMANYSIARINFMFSKYQAAIDILLKMIAAGNENNYIYNLLAESYLRSNGKDNLRLATKYYEKVISLYRDNDMAVLRLAHCYDALSDNNKLSLAIFKLEHAQYGMYRKSANYFKSNYYRNKGEFDKALQYAKKAYASNVPSIKNALDKIIINAKNIKVCHKKMNEYFLIHEDYFTHRQQAKVYFHGEYNFALDINKAKEEIAIALKMKEESTCIFSLYGNMLLEEGNYSEAIEKFKKGSQLFFDNVESCSCCVAFLAKCYYLGLGISADQNKAKQLISQLIEKEGYSVSENTLHMQAYFCLLENKNLEDAYKLLTTYFERRYSYTRYYLMSLLEQKISGKIQRKTQKFLRQSFKHASIRERNYYSQISNALVFPFMTNN